MILSNTADKLKQTLINRKKLMKI